MENFFVAIIIFLVAVYLFRRFYLIFKSKDAGCTCGSCGANYRQSPISDNTCVIDNCLETVDSEKEIKSSVKKDASSKTSERSTQG